jgi:polyhydroxyalkanoate synthesis regulator phasin
MTTRPNTVSEWMEMLPKRARKFRTRVEKEVNKRFDRAIEMLPVQQRRAVKRFTADVERFGTRLQKRGDKLVATVRKRYEEATHDLEKRVEHAVKPWTHRLDLATRTDVERLRKRVEHLERRVPARPVASA